MLLLFLRRLTCVFLLLAAAHTALAQTARFTGTITDPQGASISGADVTVLNLDDQTKLSAQTDASGQFSVPYLPAGHYQIEVHAEGFGATVSGTIEIGVGQAFVYSPQLKVGTQASQVTVQGGGGVSQVETENAEVGGTITGKEVTNLGLNGRNFVQFIDLTPGVSNQTGQDEAKVGQAGSVAYSINGGRTEYNSFLIDGADVLNVGLNKDHSTLVVYPSIDAIQEIKVLTSNYGAQYQSTGSGTTMVTIRSGTDSLHGSLYEFLRNEAFNAKGYFDVTKGAPLYRRNDFGGSVGGPLFIPKIYDGKGKTHFFFSEEARLEKSPTAYRQAVPSLSERNGDFSDVCPANFNESQRSKYPDCPVFQGGTGVPASNTNQANFFPSTYISKNAQAILNTGVIPLPNAKSGCDSSIASCYNVDVSLPTYWREELFRVDHTVNAKIQAGFHYIHDEWDETAPVPPYGFTQNSFPTINSRYYAPGLSLVGRVTAAISPVLLNEFVVGYTDSHIKLSNIPGEGVTIQRPATLDSGCDATSGQCGLTTIFNNGNKGLDGVSKLPGIVIAGNNAAYGGNGFGVDPGYIPWQHTNPTISFADNVTRVLGRHTLTGGAQWILNRRNQDNTPIGAATGDTQGILRFDNVTCSGYTGNAFADFLTLDANVTGAHICSFQQDSGQARYHLRYQIVEPYIQDDFRVSPRLTINGGLRLSLFGTFHNADNNIFNWEQSKYSKANALAVDPVTGQLRDPATMNAIRINQANPQSGLDPRVLNGLVQCGKNGISSSCMSGHLFNPAPRIGAAWDPFGNGKNSLRAGYGIFFEHGTADEANAGSLEASSPVVLDMTQNEPGTWNGIGNGLAFPLNVTAIPTKVTWAYVQQWSASIERQLPKGTLLSVAYVGSKGTHLAAERQLNQLAPLAAAKNPFGLHQPLFKSGSAITPIGSVGPGNANAGDCSYNPSPTIPGVYNYTLSNGATVAPGSAAYLNMQAACLGSTPPGQENDGYFDTNSLRTFAPGLGQIYSLENVADSEYNALQVAARHTEGNITLGVAYTYSHSFDDASDRSDATFVNSFDIHSNRSSSNFDQRHLLHVNYIYPVNLAHFFGEFLHPFDSDPSNEASHPAGHVYNPADFPNSRAAKLLLNNWEVSGITNFETGIPFTVVNGGSPNGISTLDNAGVANGQGSGSYPDIIGSPHGHIPAGGTNNSSIGPLLLNPGAFVAPRGLTFGTAGRNVLNNPRRTNSDVTLLKNFSLGESRSLQFRAESFNVFNQTQFRIYDPLLGNQAQNTISCYGGYASGYSGAGGDGVDCLTGKSFLHPVDAHRPRTLQFALKMLF